MNARLVGFGLVLVVAYGLPQALVGRAASLNVTSTALTPYRTCTLSATPVTTTSVVDASVRQGSPSSNFGTQATNNVASGSSANRRLYVRFDLAPCSPSIPATATIRLATLRLFLSGVPAVCRTVDIFRVPASWTETAITWNNQPFGTATSNPPRESRTGSFNVGSTPGCQNQVAGAFAVGATVTSDVSRFIAGSATNHGWMLRDDAENSGTTRTITSSAKELGTIAQLPHLVITYVTAP